MNDQDKTKEQLLYENSQMRRRIAELESAVANVRTVQDRAQEAQGTAPIIVAVDPTDSDTMVSTQSIDLTSIFTEDVTSSGSFSSFRTYFSYLRPVAGPPPA